MAAIRLEEVDLTRIAGTPPSGLHQLADAGLGCARLMGGLALTNAQGAPIARERSARDANPDNPGILTCLRDAGVAVSSYKDFRQLETVVRAPHTQPAFRALLDFASTHLMKIAEQHRIDTSRGIGGTRGFAVSLITDASGEQILGFLGHNDRGERIFLAREANLARVWYV